MSWTRLTIGTLFSVVLLTFSAMAQKNEISGLIGRTFIADHGIKGATFSPNFVSSGNGLTFEGNYARRIKQNGLFALALEVPVAINIDEDLNTGANLIPKDYRSYFITPSARLHVFAQNVISPWVSLGGGYGRFNESSRLNEDTPNPGKKGTGTGLLQIGIGFDARFWRSFSARLALRDFYSGLPALNVDIGKSRQHNIFVGGGLMYRF